MLVAGIIRPIAHQDVKCCGATTLAKKTHEGDGLTLDILKHCVNNQCIVIGFPPAFEELLPINEVDRDSAPPIVQNKWQVCQDFAELNQATKVPPMPQGDIRRTQQNLSGHRWITVFDFANGFTPVKSNQKISHTFVSMWKGTDTMLTYACRLASQEHRPCLPE